MSRFPIAEFESCYECFDSRRVLCELGRALLESYSRNDEATPDGVVKRRGEIARGIQQIGCVLPPEILEQQLTA